MLQRPIDTKRIIAISGSIIAIIGSIILSLDRYKFLRPRFQTVTFPEYFWVSAITAVLVSAGYAFFVFLVAKLWLSPFYNAFLRLRWMLWPYGLLLYPGWNRLFFRTAPLLPFEISTVLAFIVLMAVLRRHPLPDPTRIRLCSWLEKHRYPLLAIMILIIGIAWFGGVFGQRRKPVGDEPSYLMITNSIASDFDVMMDNDYAAKHYLRFYAGEYPMFTHLGHDGKNYPHHSIGLPLILAPVYALVKHGSDAFLVFAMRVTMLIIYTLLALAILRMIELFGINRKIAFWTVAAGMLAGPMLFYSGEIYPETPAALIFVLVVTFLGHSGGRNRSIQWLAAGAGIAFLPWLGIKYIAAAMTLFGIGLVCLYLETPRWRKAAVFHSIPLLSVLAYGIFLYSTYRNLNPGVIYTGVHPGTSLQALPPDMPTFWSILPTRLLNMVFFAWGFFLEQRIGLFFLFPASVFAFHGLSTMLKTQRRPSLTLLATISAHFGIYAWHNNWGGYCPPNRQAISIIPLLMVPIAFGFDAARRRKWPKLIAVILSIVGWRFSLTLLNNEGWLYMTMNPDQIGGGAHWLYKWSPLDTNILIKLFPLLMGPEKRWIPSIAWTIFFIGLIFGARPSHFKNRPTSRDDNGSVVRTTAYLYLCAGIIILAIVMWTPPHTLLAKPTTGGAVETVYSIDGSIAGNTGDGFWLTGGTEGRLLLSAPAPVDLLSARFFSLTPNRVKIISGKTNRDIQLLADRSVYESVKIEPWRRWGDQRLALLTINVETGIRPNQIDNKSKDGRFLGAYVAFSPEP